MLEERTEGGFYSSDVKSSNYSKNELFFGVY
jgi:hypothetical protein